MPLIHRLNESALSRKLGSFDSKKRRKRKPRPPLIAGSLFIKRVSNKESLGSFNSLLMMTRCFASS